MIEIKHRHTGSVIYRSETATNVREAVIEAVKARISLRGACLSGACLSGACLSVADLSVAILSVADLRGADLNGSDLRGADLSDADLNGSDLRGACLADADLADADLNGADLNVAYLCGAYMAGVYLCGARNAPTSLAGHTDPTEPYVRRVVPQDRAARAARYRELHPEGPVVADTEEAAETT